MGLYELVVARRSLESRLSDGESATLSYEGDGWLQKSDNIGGPELAEREFYNLLSLSNKGICPEVNEDEGVYGFPSSFLIERINNGATLGEYLRVFLEGDMDVTSLKELLEDVADKINRFHQLGWVHGDLHDRNIVVGPDLVSYIIDLGYSFRIGEENAGIDVSTIEDADEDNKYLLDALEAIIGEYSDESLCHEAYYCIWDFGGLLV